MVFDNIMLRKTDNKAQMGQMLLPIALMFLMLFIISDPNISTAIADGMNTVFYPLIGFGGNYPILTIFIAGLFVVFLSSFFQILFTDWKKQGETQQMMRAFNKELSKARKEGNTNRYNKLAKMQPQIMKKQTEAQSGMWKSMTFLFIFIIPIFIWLRTFLGGLDYYYFTVPWAVKVSLFSRDAMIMQTWLLFYLIISMVIGQIFRGAMKHIAWSDWFQNTIGKIKTSTK